MSIITKWPRFVEAHSRGLLVNEGWARKKQPAPKVLNADLVVVDVQDAFDRFFDDKFVESLFDKCRQYQRVYQVWDTTKQRAASHEFPNQVRSVSKRFGFKFDPATDAEDYLMPDVADRLREDIRDNKLVPGRTYVDKHGWAIVYVGNAHKWFYCPPELVHILKTLAAHQREVTFVGGAYGECLEDIYQAARGFGVKAALDKNYTYSAADKE
jgi:hypothetical protein